MGLSDLITTEDPFHIHKTLGAYVLLHYIYQYSCYFIYGSMNLNVWNMAPHMALHISSFVFNVLQKHVLSSDKTAMFIWEELRLHSMIFAFRACMSILFPILAPIFVFTTMFSADCATYVFGEIGTTTVRGNHGRISSRWLKRFNTAFFSISQLGATIICGGFFQSSFSPALAFATLPPIQTSAFGMTLIRKNVINKTVWQAIYAAELAFVYLLWYKETGNMIIFPMSLLCYMMRRNGVDKYTLFVSVFFGDLLYRAMIEITDSAIMADIMEQNRIEYY